MGRDRNVVSVLEVGNVPLVRTSQLNFYAPIFIIYELYINSTIP